MPEGAQEREQLRKSVQRLTVQMDQLAATAGSEGDVRSSRLLHSVAGLLRDTILGRQPLQRQSAEPLTQS